MAGSWIRFLSIIKTIRNKIVVLALALLVSLVVLEASLWAVSLVRSHGAQRGHADLNPQWLANWRLTDGDENRYDPICYFLPRAGFFRGPSGKIDRPLKKEEGTIRIMCIGDSTTYGMAVDYYHSWVYLLGQMLSKEYPGKKIEVLNAGIVGCILKQIKRIFQFYLSKYRPDILIWRVDNSLTDTYFVDTKPDFARSFLGPILYKFRTFRLFCVIADSFKRPGDNSMADKIYDSMTGRIPRPLEAPAGGLDSDFSIVEKIAQDHGTKYVVQAEYLFRMRDGMVAGAAPHNGHKFFVKTADAFKENDAKFSFPTNEDRINLVTKLPDPLFNDVCHLAKKGEAITAEEIYKYIVEHKWIETLG